VGDVPIEPLPAGHDDGAPLRDLVIEVRGLEMSYGPVDALRGIDLEDGVKQKPWRIGRIPRCMTW
jgi:hypothetical protein